MEHRSISDTRDPSAGRRGDAAAIERSTLERFRQEEGGFECQQVLRDWLPRLRARVAARDTADAADYEREVEDAGCLLEGIRQAFRANDLAERVESIENAHRVLGKPLGRHRSHLWLWPTERVLENPPTDWADTGALNIGFLEDELTSYLERPYLHHDRIDSAAINALLFSDLAAYTAAYQSGLLFGRPKLSYVLSDGDPLKRLWMAPLLGLGGFLLRWVTLPAISIGLLAGGYEWGAGIALAVWCVYLLYRLIRIPWRWRARSVRRKNEEKARETLAAMTRAWQRTRGSVISPSRLKGFVLEAEAHGVAFRPILHTIIDHAIVRDPTALVTGQRN